MPGILALIAALPRIALVAGQLVRIIARIRNASVSMGLAKTPVAANAYKQIGTKLSQQARAIYRANQQILAKMPNLSSELLNELNRYFQ